MRSTTRSAAQCALLGAGAGTIAGLLLVTHPHLRPGTWDRGDELALAVAWAVALAASFALAAIAWASAVALAAGRPRVAARLAQHAPPVRRIVELAVASSWLALSTLPAQAATSAPAPAVRDVPVVRAPAPAVPLPVPRPPLRPRSRPATSTPPRIHLVRAGDSLWLIARETLVAAGRRRPTDVEVAHYWRAVITENRATLRSRDPSLIYPGEIVTLPPVK
jgi:hypothetical protein